MVQRITIAFALLSSAPVFASSEVWTATKSIEISDGQIIIDGGKPAAFKCPYNEKKPWGKFIVHAIEVPIECNDDYMGGFFNGKTTLANLDGDAGDNWENQSLIYFDAKLDSLVLAKVSFGTSDPHVNCDGSIDSLKKQGMKDADIRACLEAKIECQQGESFLKWDKKKKSFVNYDFTGKAPARLLKAFAGYVKNCGT